MDMRHIFVTHKHVDHLLGIIYGGMTRLMIYHGEHGWLSVDGYMHRLKPR